MIIKKSAHFPTWLNSLVGSLTKKSEKVENKNKIKINNAEDMGFFHVANYLGRNTYQIKEALGLFDEGSVWYLDEDDNGDKFIVKQIDEVGNIIRRISNLNKKAEKIIESENIQSYDNYLKNIESNLDDYNFNSIKKEINNIEDQIIALDPTFKKSSSFSMINRINKIRENIDTKIAELKNEWDEESDEINECDYSEGDRIKEIKETQKYMESKLKASSGNNIKNANNNINNYINELNNDNNITFEENNIKKEASNKNIKKKAMGPVTEIPKDNPDDLYKQLEEYRQTPEGQNDTAEYVPEQDPMTGKFKLKKKSSYNLYNGRIHKGKLVRVFNKQAYGGNTNVIRCTTPECVHNYNDACTLRMIKIDSANCMNYEKNMQEEEITTAAIDNKNSEREENADIDKDIPIEDIEEIPEDEAQEEIDSNKENNTKENDIKKLTDIKSEVWEQSMNEILDEYLDIDEAEKNGYKRIIMKLEEKLAKDEITEEEYNVLLDELEEIKEESIIKEDLQERLQEETVQRSIGDDKEELEEIDLSEDKNENTPNEEEMVVSK